MLKKGRSLRYRLAALGLAVVMAGTMLVAGDMGSVKAAQAKEGVYHIYGANRYHTSLSVAELMLFEMGVKQFDQVIVATGENFADALSGSYLSYVKNAPILLINDDSANDVRSFIRRYLKDGGQIYVLGGEGVVPGYLLKFPKNNDGTEKYRIQRLSGKTRYETNIEVLKAAGVDGSTAAGDVLVCTGENFADSLSAAAAKEPIFLVKEGLTASQETYLDSLKGAHYFIIGGTGAITSATKDEFEKRDTGDTVRISGKSRYETSQLVADRFVKNPETVVIAYGANFPDGLCGGLLATTTDAAIILAPKGNITDAKAYVAAKKLDGGYVLGGSAVFPVTDVAKIFGVSATDVMTLKWVPAVQ